MTEKTLQDRRAVTHISRLGAIYPWRRLVKYLSRPRGRCLARTEVKTLENASTYPARFGGIYRGTYFGTNHLSWALHSKICWILFDLWQAGEATRNPERNRRQANSPGRSHSSPGTILCSEERLRREQGAKQSCPRTSISHHLHYETSARTVQLR